MKEELENMIEALDGHLSRMSAKQRVSNEWSLINDMHLTVAELRGQVKELRVIEKQNEGMKK